MGVSFHLEIDLSCRFSVDDWCDQGKLYIPKSLQSRCYACWNFLCSEQIFELNFYRKCAILCKWKWLIIRTRFLDYWWFIIDLLIIDYWLLVIDYRLSMTNPPPSPQTERRIWIDFKTCRPTYKTCHLYKWKS